MKWQWSRLLLRPLRQKLTAAPLTNARFLLFTSALALLAAFTVVNQIFLASLRRHAEDINDKEAKLYAVAIAEQLNRQEINVIFNEIVRKSKVPMIITDSSGHPVNWNNLPLDGWSGKLLPPKTLDQLTEEEIGWLYQRRQAMDKVNEPLPLQADGDPFGALHYGQTPVVRILRWTPLVELLITGLFCFIGYFGFHIIRSNEQSMLWVGLAKETAHQMGTPISSLLGWIDLLKMRLDSAPERDKSLRIVGEMESDLARLNRVATRFSKIGSLPELKRTDLNEIVRFTAKYYQARLPHLGKRIRIDQELGEIPPILLNGELIGWVIENLLRNAVDSIEAEEGIITITSSFSEDEGVAHLAVEDNGKGIPREHIKHIFSPGFTTKKRGWGLGLSLCRRIVEEYHEGHIFVAHSVMDGGTRFEVSLPQTPARSTRKAG